jgi:hypothetical protein
MKQRGSAMRADQSFSSRAMEEDKRRIVMLLGHGHFLSFYFGLLKFDSLGLFALRLGMDQIGVAPFSHNQQKKG